MATIFGVNGTKIKTVRQFADLPYGIAGGHLACFFKDSVAVPSAEGDGDKIWLGAIRSDAFLDGDLSKITFDDMGTSITVDIGADVTAASALGGASAMSANAITDALAGNSLSKLATAIDVATAAGSSSLMAGVATIDRHKPLWQLLNMQRDPLCEIDLFATFSGNPGTGNIHWKWVGS